MALNDNNIECNKAVLFDRVGYAGDNFARYSGDTITMAQTQCKSLRYFPASCACICTVACK